MITARPCGSGRSSKKSERLRLPEPVQPMPLKQIEPLCIGRLAGLHVVERGHGRLPVERLAHVQVPELAARRRVAGQRVGAAVVADVDAAGAARRDRRHDREVDVGGVGGRHRRLRRSRDCCGPLMATGVLHAPPCTLPVQPLPVMPEPAVPAASVECEYITSHGLVVSGLPLNAPLSCVQAAYSPPAVSMAPTTKSLVVAPNSPVVMCTLPQLTPPLQEMFTSAPLLLRPMNSYRVPVAGLMISGPGRDPTDPAPPTQLLPTGRGAAGASRSGRRRWRTARRRRSAACHRCRRPCMPCRRWRLPAAGPSATPRPRAGPSRERWRRCSGARCTRARWRADAAPPLIE